MPSPSMPEMKHSGKEWCVPVSALQMPGEDEQMNSPTVGDKVSFHGEGTLTRIEGEEAYVKPESANGKPMTTEAKSVNDDEQDSEQEFASLRGQAEQQGMA